MKHYRNLTDEGTTDVNGAWKPLKPLSEGFEFAGEDQYDNLIGRKGAERLRSRSQARKEGRAQGLSRKEARKTARKSIPTNKPARREAYLSLVKLNFRGFAYKLDAIINGNNPTLLNELKEKWRKFGDWNKLVEAVNKGKVKKPFVCGADCRKKILDTEYSYLEPITASIITASLALAGVVIRSLSDVVQQGQIGKQQRDAIEASEQQGQDEFNKLPPEEQRAILEAEAQLRKDLEATDNKKYIYIGVGILTLAVIAYFITKNKK
jgi:hypothetical protein